MNHGYLLSGIVAALAFGTTLPAQGVSTPVIPQQSFTTGMVGFTTSQTARLNVLNLNSIGLPVTTAQPSSVAHCNVELEFLDNKGTVISSTVVANFAPGTATSFDLARATVTSETASPRAEIRGVVVINPTPVPSGSTNPVGFCTVVTTLEIIDATGSTVALTSDTRVSIPSVVVPVATNPFN